MINSDEYILLLVKNDAYKDKIKKETAEYCPQYKLKFVENIEDAYWTYLESAELCRLVLIDLDFEGNSPNKNFDGIDLVLAIDSIAQQKNVKTPWIIALTLASDTISACFYNLETKSPLMEIIQGTISQINERIPVLFSALSADKPSQYNFPRRTDLPKIKFKLEDVSEDVVNQFILIDEKISKAGCTKLLYEISKKSFSSYQFGEFSALAPGYSGSGVFSAKVKRTNESSDERTFVIKICKDTKKNKVAIKKLNEEVENYINYVKLIKNHVPLLIGAFSTHGWKFIVYEFISYLGNHIQTLADELRIEITPNTFPTSPQGLSLTAIFNDILKEWHESRGEKIEIPDTNYFYESWFKDFLTVIEKKIVGFYGEIESALKKKEIFLEYNLGLGETPFRLANPIQVVNNLLSKNGDSYWNHTLQYGIVHGDLHSNNILRNCNIGVAYGEWKLIDFANIYKSAHVSQDGARLECDIKFQRVLPVKLEERFTLEVELATMLDEALAGKLSTILPLNKWSEKWSLLPDKYKLAKSQVRKIRDEIIYRISERGSRDPSSIHLDYTIALMTQSLMFVRYLNNPIKILHAWLAACLAATIIHQYAKAKREEVSLSRSVAGV